MGFASEMGDECLTGTADIRQELKLGDHYSNHQVFVMDSKMSNLVNFQHSKCSKNV